MYGKGIAWMPKGNGALDKKKVDKKEIGKRGTQEKDTNKMRKTRRPV